MEIEFEEMIGIVKPGSRLGGILFNQLLEIAYGDYDNPYPILFPDSQLYIQSLLYLKTQIPDDRFEWFKSRVQIQNDTKLASFNVRQYGKSFTSLIYVMLVNEAILYVNSNEAKENYRRIISEFVLPEKVDTIMSRIKTIEDIQYDMGAVRRWS